jgi:Cryptococcal mannosyltransferase 1
MPGMWSKLTLRRSNRRLRYLRYAVFLFVFANFLQVWRIQHHLSQPSSLHHDSPYSPGKNKRVFVASIHWNNEAILRERWNDAIVELVEVIGPANIFVSIYESGSWDDTKGALRELDQRLDKLQVSRNITLSPVTHIDEITQPPADLGWIKTPRGKKELRRIPYLSRLRNISLQPLLDLHSKGIDFDAVLFLGDVAFTVSLAGFDH